MKNNNQVIRNKCCIKLPSFMWKSSAVVSSLAVVTEVDSGRSLLRSEKEKK